MNNLARLFLAIAFTLVFAANLINAQQSDPLSLEASIPLPNVKGRIDHFSVDLKGQRIFVAAVRNHSVEIIDLKSRQRVHSITDLAEPQGVFYDASTNRLFVACALDGVTKIFDGSTYKLLTSVKFPDDADNIRYDGRSKQIIVGYAGAKQLRKREEGSGGLGFLDSDGKRVGDVVIDAHPESFQIDDVTSRIFVNVPDKQELEVVDAAKRTVLARWPVTSCKNNFPMALDAAHHRLLVGCWDPPRLLAFDTETGKEMASAEIAGKTDDLFYDGRRGRIYVMTAVGFLEVLQQTTDDHYARLAQYATPLLSQTGLWVESWDKLFVAVPQHDGKDAELRIYRPH